MAYGDANAIAMEIGEYEVLPVVEEVPVICGVHATDPRRRMWHWLGKVKEMGFSGVNNFPTHTIVDGHFRGVLEETGMSVKKEYEMVALARRMDLFSIVYVGTAGGSDRNGQGRRGRHHRPRRHHRRRLHRRDQSRGELGLHHQAHAGNHRRRAGRCEKTSSSSATAARSTRRRMPPT